ncbi:hypothetical protein Stube_49040 [Streptomyces tubercidicus]|uniref:Uncharacterized protein n=1 Tax=Streptomyces tubercidicus TaxID=47759 RepID=A0A640UZX7_9ACTN|nr:hypothetical protein Stube_49040 [Streptomyces tubercidicus]
MALNTSHAHADQFSERLVEQRSQRRFRTGPGEDATDFRTIQQGQRQRLRSKTGQQAKQRHCLGQATRLERVERELPSTPYQVAWVYIRQEVSSLVDELDRFSFLKVAPVSVHRPRVEHLVGQESTRQRQRERQPAESVGDLGSLLERAALRRQIAQHPCGVFPRQHPDMLQLRSWPPASSRTTRRDHDDAAGAGAQPAAIPQDLGIIRVVQHQQPRLGGPVEVFPYDIGARAQAVASGQQLPVGGTPVSGNGEHAGAQTRTVGGVHP